MGKEEKKGEEKPNGLGRSEKRRKGRKERLDRHPIFSESLDCSSEPAAAGVGRRKGTAPPILLRAQSPMAIEDVDLKLYTERLASLRVVSACLVDKQGQFLYYDKRAREHFEGSLNNLRTRSIFDLMIPQSRAKLARLFGQPLRDVVFKYTIYSKNTKRKYLERPTRDCGIEDVYFRYLKSLSSRIRGVTLRLAGAGLPGQWVGPAAAQTLECFLVETRPSLRAERLDEAILHDDTIRKFEGQARKKRASRGQEHSTGHSTAGQESTGHSTGGAQCLVAEKYILE